MDRTPAVAVTRLVIDQDTDGTYAAIHIHRNLTGPVVQWPQPGDLPYDLRRALLAWLGVNGSTTS